MPGDRREWPGPRQRSEASESRPTITKGKTLSNSTAHAIPTIRDVEGILEVEVPDRSTTGVISDPATVVLDPMFPGWRVLPAAVCKPELLTVDQARDVAQHFLDAISIAEQLTAGTVRRPVELAQHPEQLGVGGGL